MHPAARGFVAGGGRDPPRQLFRRWAPGASAGEVDRRSKGGGRAHSAAGAARERRHPQGGGVLGSGLVRCPGLRATPPSGVHSDLIAPRPSHTHTSSPPYPVHSTPVHPAAADSARGAHLRDEGRPPESAHVMQRSPLPPGRDRQLQHLPPPRGEGATTRALKGGRTVLSSTGLKSSSGNVVRGHVGAQLRQSLLVETARVPAYAAPATPSL